MLQARLFRRYEGTFLAFVLQARLFRRKTTKNRDLPSRENAVCFTRHRFNNHNIIENCRFITQTVTPTQLLVQIRTFARHQIDDALGNVRRMVGDPLDVAAYEAKQHRLADRLWILDHEREQLADDLRI